MSNTNPNIVTFSILSLDVWGNEKDGYIVNQAFNTGDTIGLDISKPDSEVNKDICKQVMRKGYQVRWLDIDGDYDYSLYVNRKRDGYPLVELRRIQD